MPLLLLPLYLRSDPPGATVTMTTAEGQVSCVTPCKMKPPKRGETYTLRAELPGYRVAEYPKLVWYGNGLSYAIGPNPYRINLVRDVFDVQSVRFLPPKLDLAAGDLVAAASQVGNFAFAGAAQSGGGS